MATPRVRTSPRAIKKMGAHNPRWKGDLASRGAGRSRARALYDLGPCEECGGAGFDRHHRDGDTLNNDPSNVRVLCRRCHMLEDGRLDRLRTMGPKGKKGPRPCRNCGRMIASIRSIRCGACRQYWWTYGVERPGDRLRERGLARRNPSPRPPLEGQRCLCGEPARDTHPIGSIRIPMCRRCKMLADGRGGQAPKPCAVCGNPEKPLRRQTCGRCYDKRRQRDWRNGGRPVARCGGGE